MQKQLILELLFYNYEYKNVLLHSIIIILIKKLLFVIFYDNYILLYYHKDKYHNLYDIHKNIFVGHLKNEQNIHYRIEFLHLNII